MQMFTSSSDKNRKQPKIYEIFIIDNFGKLLFYEDLMNSGVKVKEKEFKNRVKNVFGIAHALRALIQEINRSDQKIFSFNNFTTNQYKYNLYEIKNSGLKFILLTSVTEFDFTPILDKIYTEIYHNCCIRNILYKVGEPIDNPKFKQEIRGVIKDYYSRGKK